VIVTSRPEGVRRSLYEGGDYLLLNLQPLTAEQQQQMIDRRLEKGSKAHEFFVNLLKFVASRKLMDKLFDEHFRERRIEKLEEIKGDEKQYAAEGVLASTLEVLYDCAARAKPVYDAALTEIAGAAGLDTASALKLAALKGTKEGCVVDGKLLGVVPRLVEKAWESELKALQEKADQLEKVKKELEAANRKMKEMEKEQKELEEKYTKEMLLRVKITHSE